MLRSLDIQLEFQPPTAPSPAPVVSLVPPEPHRPRPALSVVVPTRNEAGNIAELVRRLEESFPALPLEIVFVDDSTDDTPEVIERVGEGCRAEILLVHRPADQRTDGLGGAVVRGLRLARAPWVCVMDADLQHPPEIVPELLAKAQGSGADLVVASRYCAAGSASSFGRLRAAVSGGSTAAARLLFPGRLRDVTDPMSGFFLVRTTAVDPDALRPNGFKILMEIIGRTAGLRVAEVPFRFGTRLAGESKASLAEGVRYLQLLLTLRFGAAPLRVARFGLVGLSGLLVNVVLMAVITELLGLFYLVSAVVATQGSTLWNFGLSERWVFAGEGAGHGRLRRAGLFLAMNNVALALRGPLLFVLTSALGINYLISNVISLGALFVLRYATADRWIWATRPATRTAAP
jgi:putative flippase GtrA